MATVTMQPTVQNPSQLNHPAEVCSVDAAETQSTKSGIWSGDLIAFKIWIIGFLIMLLFNLYDVIAGVIR
ncbi:MAG TPA: hypothetical protein VK395_14885 [Gemmataceae bacterium]|nr:hypothetical protein [Gemmataceae bacterium]